MWKHPVSKTEGSDPKKKREYRRGIKGSEMKKWGLHGGPTTTTVGEGVDEWVESFGSNVSKHVDAEYRSTAELVVMLPIEQRW